MLGLFLRNGYRNQQYISLMKKKCGSGGKMNKAVYVFLASVLASGTLFADTITLTGGTMQSFGSSGFSSSQTAPAPNVPGTPFWNNYSYDGPETNVGYLLTNSGGFTASNVFNGMDSVAMAGLGTDGSDPTAFTFDPNNAQTYDVTLLGADSGNDTQAAYGTVFGIYYSSGGSTYYDQLYGPGSNPYTDTNAMDLTSDPSRTATSYGFYATVCYGTPVNGVCPEQDTETYYTDSSMNSGIYGSTSNHFAVFSLNSSTSNNFVIAFEDGRPGSAEGTGDFNDVVVELSDPSLLISMPEPATFAFVGMGLVALGLARRRFGRK